MFRQGVAAHLRASWPERAHALELCGRQAVKVDCAACGSPHLVPFRCGARTCPTCSKAGAAAIVARVLDRVTLFERDLAAGADGRPGLAWDGPGRPRRRSWRVVVLTTPADLDHDARFDRVALRRVAKRVRKAFPRWWARTPWGRQVNDRRPDGTRCKRNRVDTAATLGLEISPRGMVHLHATIHGEYVPQADLARWWADALGEPRAIVHVSAVKGEGPDAVRRGLVEALKYATKGEKGEPRRLERAAAVESALRQVRRVELYGAIRRYGEVLEDLTPEDLHAGAAASCTDCGTEGAWGRFDLWAPERVHANGGFGRVQLDRLEAHYRARPPDPGPEVCPGETG